VANGIFAPRIEGQQALREAQSRRKITVTPRRKGQLCQIRQFERPHAFAFTENPIVADVGKKIPGVQRSAASSDESLVLRRSKSATSMLQGARAFHCNVLRPSAKTHGDCSATSGSVARR
jgi:hypothetical protein